MSAKAVTYYMVECDEPGCGLNTSDLGSEYSAWGDRGAAEDEWRDCDGVVLDDGKTLCEKHGRGHRCVECTEFSNEKLAEDVDGEIRCAACVVLIRQPCVRPRATLHGRTHCVTHGSHLPDGEDECADGAAFRKAMTP